MLNLIFRLAASLIAAGLLLSPGTAAAWNGSLSSPDQSLSARLTLDEAGRLWFRVLRDDEAVLRPSPLGIRLHNGGFEEGLILQQASAVTVVEDDYRLFTGKRTRLTYRAREMSLSLVNAEGHPLTVRFRLSNDGLAFRYEFPGQSEDSRVVVSEATGFHFPSGTRAWLQPKANAQTGWSNTNPSYEENYYQDIPVGTPSPTESGWIYPALFRHGEHWVLISETGMDGNYSGTNLARDSDDGLYRVRFPQAAEVFTNGKRLPEARLPFHSPWRLVVVGDLATIVESTLGTDLAAPARIETTDFIQPGIAAWSWGVLKDDFTIFPVQKAFVDYAADMNWPYVLVDADWDRKIGYDAIAQLAEYAAARNVGLLLWYNSSGAWNETVYSPKSRLLTRADRRSEFARLRQMGIRGVKVDFFAGDGSSVIRYYMNILEDAADFGLLVNTHGSTLPRGLQRTYPNYLTSEAVKGFEFITFEQVNADQEATHSAMLPFTRNVFDPMDFTPMVLGDIPDIERRTSNGFQLALPVLFTSGIQHLVTTPEQMAEMPGFVRDYLRHIPDQWEESRFIDGFPGRFVVIARRAGQHWYVAGINADDQKRQLRLNLGFTGQQRGLLITDGDDWRTPAASEIESDEATVTVPHGTGFVIIMSDQPGEQP